MMSTLGPSPKTWTIRLKHRKLTVFVHADPLQTLSFLKSELYKILRETRPDGKLHDRPIPGSPDSIYFAKPVDTTDWKQGWTPIEDPSLEDLGLDNDFESAGSSRAGGRSKGKGKGKAGDVNAESIKSLGLRDSSVLAFKWTLEDEMMDVEDDWDLDFITYEDLFADDAEA